MTTPPPSVPSTEIKNEQTAPGSNLEISNLDLDPAIVRTMEMTYHLVVAVGGTGKEGLLALAYGLGEQRMGFGRPNVLKDEAGKPTGGVFVDAVLIDGDASTFDVAKNEGARVLKEAGVHGCHLYIPGQNVEFRKAGMLENMTAGLPSQEDTRGCNAMPKVGRGRYAIARQRPARNAQGEHVNPKALIRDVVGSWKTPEKPLAKRTIYVDVFTGSAGGTGPCADAVVADAITEIQSLYGTDHEVLACLWVMSGESFGLDGTIEDGKQRTRDFNSLVTTLQLVADSFRGGVILPDGNFVAGIPRLIYILDGQSSAKRIPKGGAYQPVSIAAKSVLADVTGATNGREQSAISNIGADQQLLEIPMPGEGDGRIRPIRRFSAVGACETIPEPHRVILEREKRKCLFANTVGLTDLSEQQTARIAVQKEQVIPSDLLERLEKAGMLQPPSAREDQIITKGQEKDAAVKVDRVVRNFMAVQLVALTGNVEEVGVPVRDKSLERLVSLTDTLRNEEGLQTAHGFLLELQSAVGALAHACTEQEAMLAKKIKTELTAKPVVDALTQNVKDAADSIPRFLGRERAIHNLNTVVTQLVTHLNTTARAVRDLRIREFLLEQYIPQLLARLDTEIRASEDKLREARTFLENIKEEFDPTKTGTTALDFPIPVNPVWQEDSAALRSGLEGFDSNSYRKLVSGIKLKPADTDLLSRFTPNMAKLVGASSSPLMRSSKLFRETLEEPKGRVHVFAVPREEVEVGREGDVKGTRKIPKPEGFQVVPVASSDRVLALQHLHGLAPYEITYLLDTFNNFLKLPPAEREKYFTLKGDMVAIGFYELAETVASLEFARDNRGSVQHCAGCNIAFYRPVKNEAEQCPGCSSVAKAAVAPQRSK